MFIFFYFRKSLKDKLNNMISEGKFNELSDIINSLSIKQGDKTYHFKSTTLPGDDYWIIHHYKTNNIADIAPQDR